MKGVDSHIETIPIFYDLVIQISHCHISPSESNNITIFYLANPNSTV